jgi:hypothetical protein
MEGGAISAMYNGTSILAAPTPYICVSKLVLPKSGRGALTSPPIARPANITPVFPMAATCIAEPTQKTPPVIIGLIFRPTLSPRGATAKEPKKQPAWSRETMLAWNALTVASSAPISPKSLMCVSFNAPKRGRTWHAMESKGGSTTGTYFSNGFKVIAVPMNARSYPKRKAPMDATNDRM